jgi:hypothetical protein
MTRDDDIHPSLATPTLPTDLTVQQNATPEHTSQRRPRRLVAVGALLAARQRPRRLVAVGAGLAAVMVLGGGVLFPVSGRIAGPHNALSALTCMVTARLERGIRSMGSDPSAGLVLHLSATTVKPGQVITRTVTGGSPGYGTSVAMQLQQCINGSWQTIYYLNLSQTDPQDAAGSNLLITSQALPFSGYGYKARIPPVPAGTYRISQDLSTPKGSGTVYAMITVTAS